MAVQKVNLGNKIRIIRQMKGMKQEVLASGMGITQQSVSKMEKKKNVTDEQIAEAAKVLDVTSDFIKSFDEKVVVNNNFLFNDNIINPVKEVIEYFKEEVAKRDERIKELEAQLAEEGSKKGTDTTPEASATDGNVRNIGSKANK